MNHSWEYSCLRLADIIPSDSHALPDELHEWLFPPTGATRDLASLQVVLGPGDGDFVASDCNDRVERKPVEQPPRTLKRASTFRSYDGATGARPLSMTINSVDTPSEIRQRRSATISSLEDHGNSRRTSLIYEEPTALKEENRNRLPSLASLVPLVSRVNRIRRRPTSMNYTGAQPLVSTESPRSIEQKKPAQPTPSLGSHEQTHPIEGDRPGHAATSGERAPRTTSAYVDAGVQTDNPPSLPPSRTDFDECARRRHRRDTSSVSSASSIFTSYSEMSTRRSSLAEEGKPKIDYPQQYSIQPAPILMGRMQDYFRAPGYQLGDAFRI